MGARKRNRAEQLKEERKNKAFAVLKNCPTSPRKMRLVADMIRGQEVNKALDMLRFNPKEASNRLEKLVLSAVAKLAN
jgi:large subunit ribosomal protein L22